MKYYIKDLVLEPTLTHELFRSLVVINILYDTLNLP